MWHLLCPCVLLPQLLSLFSSLSHFYLGIFAQVWGLWPRIMWFTSMQWCYFWYYTVNDWYELVLSKTAVCSVLAQTLVVCAKWRLVGLQGRPGLCAHWSCPILSSVHFSISSPWCLIYIYIYTFFFPLMYFSGLLELLLSCSLLILHGFSSCFLTQVSNVIFQ